MIVTGKRHDSNSPGGAWKEQRERYEREPNERIWQEQIQQDTLRYQNLPTVEPTTYTSRGPTPDDAYSEGYDEGYDEGYEEGYDEGYTFGQSEYE